MSRLEVGDVVKHFKRELLNESDKSLMHVYKIICMDAIDTTTDEEVVIYQALYPPYKTFTRPVEEFLSKVDKKKYPNIKQEYRLEKFC